MTQYAGVEKLASRELNIIYTTSN